MRDFSTQWLSLREPLDAVSRAARLGATVTEVLRPLRQRQVPLQVIDLGAGSGANLRYLAPLLRGRQEWLLVDRDPVLLDAAAGRLRAWVHASADHLQLTERQEQLYVHAAQFECRVRCVCLDLATELERLALPDDGLLSACALLDLVSEAWLCSLAQRAASAAATVWFALTYDGRIACTPAEPEDPQVRELFNRHQLTDKGFGPALGPGAAHRAEQLFAERGYRMWREPSDWRIGPGQQTLQHALIDGWFEAALEMAPASSQALRDWQARRRAHIDAGRSELIVGHVDLAGSPRPP